MAIVTVSGYIVEAKILSGTSHDGTIQDHMDIDTILREKQLHAGADGVFSGSDVVDVPFSGPQIWREHLDEGETMEEYVATAKAKMKFNEGLGFWRARVEHFFSRTRWGRFNIFKNYVGSTKYLFPLVECSLIAMNIETWVRHGDGGRYGVVDAARKEKHQFAMESHLLQSKRYPQKFVPVTFEQYEAGERVKKKKKKDITFVPKKPPPRTTETIPVPKKVVQEGQGADKERATKLPRAPEADSSTFPKISEDVP